MSFFYLYNPKFWADSTMNGLADAIRKRRKQEDDKRVDEIAVKKESAAYTEELNSRIEQYQLAQARMEELKKMAEAEAVLRELEKIALIKLLLARAILDMEEEEGVMVMLLLH